MLRNSLKASVYGLIALIFSSCGHISPLIGNESESFGGELNNIKIVADVYYEYKIRNILTKTLSKYSGKLSQYRIKITITEENDAIAYSEKRVIKEHGRIIGKIEICDKNHNELFNKSIDSFSTYEVDDNLPMASLSSQKQSRENMIIDIAENIALVIVEFVKRNL